MHVAPPVRMNWAQDRSWRVFVTFCACAAAANAAAWAATHWQAANLTAAMVAMLAAIAAGTVVWLRTERQDAAMDTLAWDGAVWTWSLGSLAPVAGEVRVRIDLGAWVLLRFSPLPSAGRHVWLPVARGAAGGRWPAWRAAVYAPAPAPEPRSRPERT